MSIEKISRTNRQDNLKKGTWENNYVRMQDLDAVIDDTNDELDTLTTAVSDNAADILTNANDIADLQTDLGNRISIAEVTLSAADILAMYATPVEVIAAPGTGKVIEFLGALVVLDKGSTAFTGGGAITFLNSVNGADLSASLAATAVTSSSDTVNIVPAASSSMDYSATQAGGESIQITNTTAAFAAGDGVVKLKISYRIHDTGL